MYYIKGISVEGLENIQEILTKQLVLCQYICALSILRTGWSLTLSAHVQGLGQLFVKMLCSKDMVSIVDELSRDSDGKVNM